MSEEIPPIEQSKEFDYEPPQDYDDSEFQLFNRFNPNRETLSSHVSMRVQEYARRVEAGLPIFHPNEGKVYES